MIVALWQASLIISVLSFLFGLLTKSKTSLLISFFTSLPIAYYFFGANNALKLVALFSVVPLVIKYLFYRHERRRVHS
ncbi:hypothetical protein M3193_12055 [Sporosarcina luteola]|uniref:hypothetical protein n=1 Tax=Sporosarcina luteola TaxID=582850 RepID=UPI00203CDF46|nr:hypothetical protein [Sporosarcina luteola]MCM3744876.1 hypothetical protein [Sporosarcina luteola]